jgi:hypothetical protein
VNSEAAEEWALQGAGDLTIESDSPHSNPLPKERAFIIGEIRVGRVQLSEKKNAPFSAYDYVPMILFENRRVDIGSCSTSVRNVGGEEQQNHGYRIVMKREGGSEGMILIF